MTMQTETEQQHFTAGNHATPDIHHGRGHRFGNGVHQIGQALHLSDFSHQMVSIRKYVHLDDCMDVLARIICILCVAVQGGFLDYYLIHYNSTLWSAWILIDVLAIGFISASLYTSYYHFIKTRRQGKAEKVERIPAFFSWMVYSLALIARVAILFKHTAHYLTYNDVLGPNMLKTMIALTAVIYLLFVLSHHDAEPFSSRNTYISYLSGAVTLDIFDSVAFLDVLFTQESRILLPFSLENAIICFACINLFLPTVALLRLNSEQFGLKEGGLTIRLIHTLCYLGLVNLPFMVMRILLYHFEQDVSVFLIKNIMGIFIALRILYYEFLQQKAKKCAAATANNGDDKKRGEDIELRKMSDLNECEKALIYNSLLPGRKTASNFEFPCWWAEEADDSVDLMDVKTELPPPAVVSRNSAGPSYLSPDDIGSPLACGDDRLQAHSVADLVTEIIRERKKGVNLKEKVKRTLREEREQRRRAKSAKYTDNIRPRTKTM